MMERYEKYKDSGIKWIGKIPEHWEVKRLKYLANSTRLEKNTMLNKRSVLDNRKTLGNTKINYGTSEIEVKYDKRT